MDCEIWLKLMNLAQDALPLDTSLILICQCEKIDMSIIARKLNRIFFVNRLFKFAFPILELEVNFRNSQARLSLHPLQLMLDEIIYLPLLTLSIWLEGLAWFFFYPQSMRYRGLGLPDCPGQ
jgi:hypothetical protein